VSLSFLDSGQRATWRSSQPVRCVHHESSALHGKDSCRMGAGCLCSCEANRRLCFLSMVWDGTVWQHDRREGMHLWAHYSCWEGRESVVASCSRDRWSETAPSDSMTAGRECTFGLILHAGRAGRKWTLRVVAKIRKACTSATGPKPTSKARLLLRVLGQTNNLQTALGLCQGCFFPEWTPKSSVRRDRCISTRKMRDTA